ncbi:hypothetical protein E3N88_38224 [Mikania micrantha]|uniref:Uncharacterized protein n=1 Tax=Mikania micrantha TaxID=192012 RepID=A0A5N6LTG3_9ASTR|nr:hypothetical protein E3N88_38224 [Mikania micrantha]
MFWKAAYRLITDPSLPVTLPAPLPATVPSLRHGRRLLRTWIHQQVSALTIILISYFNIVRVSITCLDFKAELEHTELSSQTYEPHNIDKASLQPCSWILNRVSHKGQVNLFCGLLSAYHLRGLIARVSQLGVQKTPTLLKKGCRKNNLEQLPRIASKIIYLQKFYRPSWKRKATNFSESVSLIGKNKWVNDQKISPCYGPMPRLPMARQPLPQPPSTSKAGIYVCFTDQAGRGRQLTFLKGMCTC